MTTEQPSDAVRTDPATGATSDPDRQHADLHSADEPQAQPQYADVDQADPRHSDELHGDARDGDPESAGRPATGDTGTGRATADSSTAERERLVPTDRADSFGSRWDTIKVTFVDEPRQAVARADELVGELLEELEELFRKQRRSIEQGLDTDETSTEDLRLALRRYRSFFDRLLSL
jgi:hypothetical protein